MAVRLTESRLPAGFSAQDLGEACVDDDNAPEYALVSTHTSPLRVGANVSYVVFVLRPDVGPGDLSYRFTAKRPPLPDGPIDEEAISEDRAVGEFALSIDRPGEYIIRVDVLDGDTVVKELSLRQEATSHELGIEAFFESRSDSVLVSVGALGGDRRVTLELLQDYMRYIYDGVAAEAHGTLPVHLVAALLQYNMLNCEESQRRKQLENAASVLKGGPLRTLVDPTNEKLGVAQISVQTLAMLVGSAPGSTYTEWSELPPDSAGQRTRREAWIANLNALGDAEVVKVDLYNLLRFPKTAVRMAARLLEKLKKRPNRYPLHGASELYHEESARAVLVTEYLDGAMDADVVQPSRAGREVATSGFRLPVLHIYEWNAPTAHAMAYGGYDLKRDDNDTNPRWGGQNRVADGFNHVRALQQDLAELGFEIVESATPGKFDAFTEWAVREFQIYSKMLFAAFVANDNERYIASLARTENLQPYIGFVSGVLNAATRVRLQYWKAKEWRCPVVMEANSRQSSGMYVPLDNPANLWDPRKDRLPAGFIDESPPNGGPPSGSPLKSFVRVLDLSGYYDIPGHRFDAGGDPDGMALLDLGYWYNTHHEWGGPVSMPLYGRMWRGPGGAEVLPISLFEQDEGTLANDHTNQGRARRSTFMVIRVVAEVENLAFFDSINAYDRAYISLGLCHWTLGRPGMVSDDEREGELGGLLSYMKYRDAATFRSAFQFFGVDVQRSWITSDGVPSGEALFRTHHRKYTSWLTLHQESGTKETLDTPPYRTTAQTENDEDAACGHFYFKTWHWFYRFQMAARTMPMFRRWMWDAARIRIRDILTIGWGVPELSAHRVNDTGTIMHQESGFQRALLVGDVFTSERAVAILLRMHVYQPYKIVSYKDGVASPGPYLLGALANAKADEAFSMPPEDWGHYHESKLIEALVAQAETQDLKRTINFVENYPVEEYGWSRHTRGYELDLDTLIGSNGTPDDRKDKALRKTRGAFILDWSGLPPTPYLPAEPILPPWTWMG